MTTVKITEDILLKELFELFPEAKELLKPYGYSKVVDLGIEEVVVDKLSLKGLLRLGEVEEERFGEVIREIQSLYNKKLEEK
ncbi:hypothetical protein BCF55_1321 [Hydrogenivirga caldilitoris]|uniref:DUF1858 domain-containing protein n=1 Tax=Hydrogenivirga caldilitoris TaxID=246264 RepID=A0A497XV49_9AQUI|nr:DUF1858 domain-containing protein [Hydrogenivirga caldilitoris]RLJ71032.1 hypothetical protein BCF55_1321 [Hydrogenivirga caldilitoris]